MKRTLLVISVLFILLPLKAQEQIIKTGLNFGPLPAVAYDADKGFQYGLILNIFNYGDGSSYPNYDSKTYLEYSHFTKGSNLIQVRHDNKSLFDNIRWSSALRINLDKAYDFYGFNGYQSYYMFEPMAAGKDKTSDMFIFSPFYRMKCDQYLFKSELIGQITPALQWEAGLFFNYFNLGSIDYDNVNKGKEDIKKFPHGLPTLYDIYKAANVIPEKDADGGYAGGFRLGMVYDTRDKEGAPTKGIWAEAHIAAALPGISETPYVRYSLTWRNYLPIIRNDVLTFAYRLNYEGNFGDKAPFYAVPFMTVMGEKSDIEGMGGYNTVRGIMRTRSFGLDMATYNAELRWRFVNFKAFNQNIALGLSAFSDGTVVTRGLDMGVLSTYAKSLKTIGEIIGIPLESNIVTSREKDSFHITAGAGFRFIMNENFIVAVEYGMPLSKFYKESNPLYRQDGDGALYINIGYLF